MPTACVAWSSGFWLSCVFVFYGNLLAMLMEWSGYTNFPSFFAFPQNVFCNPAFELEGEREEKVGGFRTTVTPEPIKSPATSESIKLIFVFFQDIILNI